MILLDKYKTVKNPASSNFNRLRGKPDRLLESGDDVLISGFGKFYLRKKAPRKGRNPATGGDLVLDARRVVMFKSSELFKKKLYEAG